MNKFRRLTAAFVALTMALAFPAWAAGPAYPINTPVYIPSAIAAPQAFTGAGDYTYQVSGISAATVRVSGTCTGLAAAVQGSNDGTNFTTIPVTPVVGGAAITSLSGTGFWRANLAGFTNARVHITALSASCTVAMAGTASPSTEKIAVDPCSDPQTVKSSAVIAQGASATTKVVDAVTSDKIYVCGFVASATGTNPTFTFKSGTHASADCDTGTVSLSGAITPSATQGMVSYGIGATAFATTASKQLCLTTAATTDVQGILTYVQQ